MPEEKLRLENEIITEIWYCKKQKNIHVSEKTCCALGYEPSLRLELENIVAPYILVPAGRF